MVNELSNDKKFDPEARYFTEQLKQESDYLHTKLQKLTEKNSELQSQLVVNKQIENQDRDEDSEEIKAMKEEIDEMKASLDRKEYLLQY
jgi:uncharacterized protein (UPF0305 family)